MGSDPSAAPEGGQVANADGQPERAWPELDPASWCTEADAKALGYALEDVPYGAVIVGGREVSSFVARQLDSEQLRLRVGVQRLASPAEARAALTALVQYQTHLQTVAYPRSGGVIVRSAPAEEIGWAEDEGRVAQWHRVSFPYTQGQYGAGGRLTAGQLTLEQDNFVLFVALCNPPGAAPPDVAELEAEGVRVGRYLLDRLPRPE